MQASCFQFGILFRILSLTFKPVTASLSFINCVNMCACVYTRKNACSVTAFNSTDIRSVQDNVATPVTAMMVTVCISTDTLSSVFYFIWYQQLPSVLLVHHACYSLFLQTATVCSQHTCIILLHQTGTALTTQQTVPVWYRQFWQQSDTAMISYLSQAWRCNRL